LVSQEEAEVVTGLPASTRQHLQKAKTLKGVVERLVKVSIVWVNS
jgi:hypothetical protein